MKNIILSILFFSPLSALTQDTISSDKLIRVLKDSSYILEYNGEIFNGTQKRIVLFDWDFKTYITPIIPQEEWPDSIKQTMPDTSNLNPYQYGVNFNEVQNGVATANWTSYVNGEVASISKEKGKRRTIKIYHFEEGDTIPGVLKQKFKYYLGGGISEKWFDKNGDVTKKIKYWKVGSRKHKKGIRLRRSKHKFISTFENKIVAYNVAKYRRHHKVSRAYHVLEDESKGAISSKMISIDGRMTKYIKYDFYGKKIRLN